MSELNFALLGVLVVANLPVYWLLFKVLFDQARWSFLPWVASSRELVSIVEQSTHVLGIEVFSRLHIKIITDEGEVKIHIILLSS